MARSRGLRTCFALLFEEGITQAAEEDPGPVEIRGVDASSGSLTLPRFGDESSGVMFKVEVDAGLSFEMYFSLAFVRIGRFVASYSVQAETPDGGVGARDAAIQATVDRMTRAGA